MEIIIPRQSVCRRLRDVFADADRVVLLCIFAACLNSADRVIMPIGITGLSAEYSYSLVQQGWILSAFPAGYISSQIIGSCAVSQLGSRRLLFAVVFLWSLSTFLVPFAAESFHLLIFTRITLGLAEGLGLPTIYHIFAQRITPERRSSYFSYLAGAGSIGQTIAAFIFPHLAWELPFYFLGSVGFYWCILWEKYSSDVISVCTEQLLCQKTKNPLSIWTRFIFLPPLLAVYCAHFCMNWTSYVIMHWLPTYLRISLHASSSGVSLAALPYLANSVVSLEVGNLVDYLVNNQKISLLRARISCTVVGLVLPGIFIVALAFVKNLFVAVMLASVSMGMLAFNSAGHLNNHVDIAPKYAGITFAISNTIATLSGLLVGPFSANLIMESSGRWLPVFTLAGVLNFVGAVIYANYASVNAVV